MKHQRDFILIFGQTGSGKSWRAREIARSRPRVLVADAGFGDFAPIPSVPTYDDLLAYLERERAFAGSPFRVSYEFRPEELDLAFSTALALRDTLLVIEEADRFKDSSGSDYSETISRGRHYGVSVLFVALQPTSISTDVRRQATEIIAYRQLLPDDVDWLSKIVGEEAYTLPTLSGPPQDPPHPFLHWTPAAGSRIVTPPGIQVVSATQSAQGPDRPLT